MVEGGASAALSAACGEISIEQALYQEFSKIQQNEDS